MYEQTMQYHILRNTGLDLCALLEEARKRGTPVAVERETVKGRIAHDIARVAFLGIDYTTLRTADGGEVRCDLWRINRAALIREMAVAA